MCEWLTCLDNTDAAVAQETAQDRKGKIGRDKQRFVNVVDKVFQAHSKEAGDAIDAMNGCVVVTWPSFGSSFKLVV